MINHEEKAERMKAERRERCKYWNQSLKNGLVGWTSRARWTHRTPSSIFKNSFSTKTSQIRETKKRREIVEIQRCCFCQHNEILNGAAKQERTSHGFWVPHPPRPAISWLSFGAGVPHGRHKWPPALFSSLSHSLSLSFFMQNLSFVSFSLSFPRKKIEKRKPVTPEPFPILNTSQHVKVSFQLCKYLFLIMALSTGIPFISHICEICHVIRIQSSILIRSSRRWMFDQSNWMRESPWHIKRTVSRATEPTESSGALTMKSQQLRRNSRTTIQLVPERVKAHKLPSGPLWPALPNSR